MTFEQETSDNTEQIGVLAVSKVYLDNDGLPVIDVRDRTGLWVHPEGLRNLADRIEEATDA